jgi:hypothetical protein
MPAGRPSDYKPEYCEQVIEMGRLGKSIVQMACGLDVVRNTLDNWAAEHPEFLSSFTRAKQLSQDWWENAGQTGMLTPGMNAGIWSRSMAARFPEDYTERQKRELTGAGGGAIQQVHRIERVIVDPKA